MLKIIKKIFKNSKEKTVDYYAKINHCEIENCTITKLKSNKPLATHCVILINEGRKQCNRDWLSYRGSYDLVIFLNCELKVIKTQTNVIFDVSFFDIDNDSNETVYKKPQEIKLDDELLDLLKNSEETLVWAD